jgi:hypothetical protein
VVAVVVALSISDEPLTILIELVLRLSSLRCGTLSHSSPVLLVKFVIVKNVVTHFIMI